MTALIIASITFVCTFGGALLATIIRPLLPATHLSKESQDVVRLGMGLIATMTALLLGLVTAAAKSTYDTQDVAVKNSAANLITLDRLLARYGPDAAPLRESLRRTVSERVRGWPGLTAEASGSSGSATARPGEDLEAQILNLPADTDAKRWYRAEALKLTSEVLKTRWRLLSSGGSVSRTFLFVVISWLTVTFASFGLYAPRNATVMGVLLIASLSVAAAIFLVLEMDDPFSGVVMVSSRPLQNALTQLGQ